MCSTHLPLEEHLCCEKLHYHLPEQVIPWGPGCWCHRKVRQPPKSERTDPSCCASKKTLPFNVLRFKISPPQSPPPPPHLPIYFNKTTAAPFSPEPSSGSASHLWWFRLHSSARLACPLANWVRLVSSLFTGPFPKSKPCYPTLSPTHSLLPAFSPVSPFHHPRALFSTCLLNSNLEATVPSLSLLHGTQGIPLLLSHLLA